MPTLPGRADRHRVAAPPLPAGCEPVCPGCSHRHLTPDASAAQKTAWLARALGPWAGRLAPLQRSGEELGYRDRACLSGAWNGSVWEFGLIARRVLVPIPECPVHSRRVRETARALAPALPPFEHFPLLYLVQSGAQATLVVKSAGPVPLDWLDDALAARLAAAGLEGLWLHLHPCAGKRIFAKNGWRLLWGAPRSHDAFGNRHGPTAFQQLVPALYGAALAEAESFLAPGPGDGVVDLYCGLGTTLRRWSDRGAAAIGVELGAEAVACARDNAPGVPVLRGSCAARLPQLGAWAGRLLPARRLAYLNPPRTGLEPAVVRWLLETYRPARLAYLSCSAGTLGRDLEQLAAGYRVVRLAPYDFFPRTHHVETQALLVREEC